MFCSKHRRKSERGICILHTLTIGHHIDSAQDYVHTGSIDVIFPDQSYKELVEGGLITWIQFRPCNGVCQTTVASVPCPFAGRRMENTAL